MMNKEKYKADRTREFMKEIRKNFLSNISVAKKSFILLLVTTVGLLFVGFLEYIGLYNIKQNIKTTHTQQIEAISNLHTLSDIYNINILNHIRSFQTKKIDKTHTMLNLQESMVHLSQAWLNLKKLKTSDTKQLQTDIRQMDKVLSKITATIENKNTHMLTNNLLSLYQSELNKINKNIKSLQLKHFQKLKLAKQKIDNHYDATLFTTAILIIILISITVTLAYTIYRDIKKIIFNLSNVVEKKTKDYQELALQLEYKVNKEVIKNREKDQIMYQHARLAAMGEMIGNIAHQWRQPLNALTVLIQSFGIKSMSGNLSQEFIDKQVDEGLRLANQMSNTIEDFKNFFSPHKDREYFGIVETLKETLELVEFFCKDEHIDIKLIAKEEIRVYGYSNEFSQVILNLLNNARDNFKQKDIQKDRKIIIKVEKKNKPEPFVMISFIDNGGGIDANIIDRIFEPYFTTKHKSTGTGIGLYMSKQIIEKQMHGLVTMKNITSKLGTKTTYQCAQFIIAIPIK